MFLFEILLSLFVLAVIAMVAILHLAPERSMRLYFAVKRNKANLVTRQITMPDGLRYAYMEGGAGEPLLLLHGFGANKDNFLSVSRLLTRRYHVICLDQIGFGESDHPSDISYEAQDQAERLHAFVQALGFETIHFGGNSMGGLVAMTYAAMYPSEVKSLWLLAPAGVWSVPESDFARFMKSTGRNLLLVKEESDYPKALAFATEKPLSVPRPILKVLARERIRNLSVEENIFTALSTESIERRVDGLSVPALIVWGAQDRVLHPASADVLHKLLPNSKVILMQGVGHLSMVERPEQCVKDYLAFRKDVDER